MTNKVYDRLKTLTMIVLPAIATLYGTLGDIWDWPYQNEIVGTIAAVTTFLGTILQISSYRYRKGENND